MKKRLLGLVKEKPERLALLYFIPYAIWFFTLEALAEPRVWIYSPLDALIPFCEWFVIPYGLWFPYFLGALAFFLRRDRQLFLQLCFVMFGGMTICLLIYTLAPNAINLRQEIVGNNVLCNLARMIRKLDTPTSVCPSIHVSSTVAVHWAIHNYKGFGKKAPLIRAASLLLALAICASTVFLKQHSVVDVAWGFILTLGLVCALRLWSLRRQLRPQGLRPLNRG